MPKYRLIAADALTDNIKAEIPMASATLDLELNRVESFSPVVPLSLTRTVQVPRPYRATVLALNPELYIRFSEVSGTTSADIAKGHNGTIHGAAYSLGVTGALSGDTDRALTLGGTNAYVQVSYAATLQIGNLFTMKFWVRRRASAANNLIFQRQGTSGQVRVLIHSSGAVRVTSSDLSTVYAMTNASLQTEVWQCVVIRHMGTGAGDWAISIDGVDQSLATDAAVTLAPAGTDDIFIGSEANGSSAWLAGDIDEFALWPGTVLTDAQLTTIYQSGIGKLETYTSTYQVVTRASLEPLSTSLYLERDGQIVWGGLLWGADPDVSKRTLTLKVAGFLSYYWRRLLTQTLTFTATDQVEIVRQLALQAVANGVNITVPGSFTASGVLRDRTWNWYEGQIIGDLIEKLAQVDQGFDFSIKCAWSGNMPSKSLKVYYPQRGVGPTDNHLLWDFAAPGVPGAMLLGLKAPADASGNANYMLTTGAQTANVGASGTPTLYSIFQDLGLLSTQPRLDSKIAYSDVIQQATLDQHSIGDLSRSRITAQPITAQLRPNNPNTKWGNWDIGDYVQVRGADGWLTINALYRVLKASFAIVGESEVVTVTLAQPGQ